MKERPILFSGSMVRALLAGTKTQTRRAVKHRWPHLNQEPWYATGRVLADLPTQPGAWMEFRHRTQDAENYGGSPASTLVLCPYGKVGDRLWVRESHWWLKDEDDPTTGYTPEKLTLDDVEFRADGESTRHGWRPSIHMPRWASRILLEITEVRVERLQDISRGDAMAEGCPFANMAVGPSPRDWYAELWDQINGAGAWASNPWCWSVSFKII